MRAELQTSDVPKVAFYRDPRIRAIFYQLLVVSLVFLGGYILVSNTMANLAKLGVADRAEAIVLAREAGLGGATERS